MKTLRNVAFFIFSGILISSFFACGPEEPKVNREADSLAALNRAMGESLSEKDSNMAELIAAFNEIQENMSYIRQKQGMINEVATKGGDVESKKRTILDGMQTINTIMDENKAKVKGLTEKLSKSNSKISELEKFVNNLNALVNQKDSEIVTLKTDLETKNFQIGELNKRVEGLKQESGSKTKVINTAYFTAGTKKELTAKGVITREGGFIGIGKREKLSDQFNTANFQKIDITEFKSLKLEATKIKLITTHPAGSYVIQSKDATSTLIINDEETFWSANKYLVVLIEKK
jgi:predicted  nucleic acid-binding Zn-ribbon protein